MRTLLPIACLVLSSAFSLAQSDDGRSVKIPVVIHVIYIDSIPDNGISENVRDIGNNTTRIPREKIEAEFLDLQKDFQRKNTDIGEVISDYKSVIGNPNIQFALKDIVYVKAEPGFERMRDNRAAAYKLSPPQSPGSFLNIYITPLRFSGGGSEGVTNVPISKVNLENDAVNLNYKWVGLGYRLLSHEVGHWLGLWHVDDKNQVKTDSISDIPVQTRLTDAGCVACTDKGVKVIRQQRELFSQPNTNNFMDYSGCRRMFSVQQSAYMRKLIMRLRPGIWAGS